MTYPSSLKSLLILCCLVPALAQAQTAPASGPATAAAPDLGAMEVTITGVEGMVQVRDAEDQPWRKCTPGMTVGAGAEFRTGPKSAVRCQIPPDQTFTIDRLGTMKVLTALQQGGKVKTDLMMKYGRTRYDIEQAGIEHESTIRSPNGVLALRGTQVSFYDQPPFTPQAVSLTGRAVYAQAAAAKRQVAFGGKGKGKTILQGDHTSAAETGAKIAQVQSVIDPKSVVALTQAEAEQLAIEVSRGAIRFDRLIIGGFQPPPTDLAAAGLLPGKLNFVATWTGFADLDLFVIVNPGTAQQQILGNPSVAGLLPGIVQQTLPSGATVPFDKVSTSKGDYEIAYWPKNNYAPGLYGIGVIHHDFRDKAEGYSASSQVKLEVYQDGKKLNTVVLNPDEVQNDETPIFGTTYQDTTNLNTGKDTLATVALIPESSVSTRKQQKKSVKPAAPVPTVVIPKVTVLPARAKR